MAAVLLVEEIGVSVENYCPTGCNS